LELEAKFDVLEPSTHSELAVASVLGHFRLGDSQALHVTDHYIDTKRRNFFGRGFYCRLRTGEGGVLVTMKGRRLDETDDPPEIYRREEVEQRLVNLSFDHSFWPEGPARRLANDVCKGEPLVPVLTLEQDRLERVLYEGDRAVATLTLDRVTSWTYQGEGLAFTVAEIELGPLGMDADLQRASAAILSFSGIVPSTGSKFDRVSSVLRQETLSAKR
jgi:inorganic triphosphatase YgiF